MDQSIYKLVIIGSGPAGLTAGIYGARADLQPIIFDGPSPGGQLMSTSYVENWPGEKKISGPLLINNMRKQAEILGCRFIAESVTNISTSSRPFSITTDNGTTYAAHAIIIATGAHPKRLGCPGEKTYWGKGVSSCAVCDGTFVKDKEVIIVGGGNSAVENALYLTNITNKITIVHILDKLTASPILQKRVLNNSNITILFNSTVQEIRGNKQHVQEVLISDKKTGQQHILKADGVFVSIGLKPNTDFLKGTVDLDKWGYITIWQNKKQRPTSSSVEGIFAAGDVFDYLYKQAITASGSGCMAALDAERYLDKQRNK